MKRKIIGLTFSALLFLLSFPADAQQPKKVQRIGLLSSGSPSSTKEGVEAFRQRLHELGYVEGQNIVIEYRYAEGLTERLPDLAADLVKLKVDIIVVSGTPATQAAKNATKTIPIVMYNVTDPVGTGLIASLPHPGGNITGLSNLYQDLGGKQLELLKEAVPKISRVTVLWDPANAAHVRWLGELKIAAGALRVTLQPVEVHGPDDFEPAFQRLRERAPAPSSCY